MLQETGQGRKETPATRGLPPSARNAYSARMNPLPPPLPPEPEPPRGFCLFAVVLGTLALAASLPLLWWRITMQPVATSAAGETVGSLAQAFTGVDDAPFWYVQLRAGAVIAAFLTAILAAVGMIQGHSKRLGTISIVLTAGALIAASPGLGLWILVGLIALVVIALVLGIS